MTTIRVARTLLLSLLATSTALGESPPSAAPGAPAPAPSAPAPSAPAPSAPAPSVPAPNTPAPSVPAPNTPAPPASSGAAPPLLAIVSDASCPAPAAVGALLREILGLSAAEHVDDVAHLVHEDGLLRVSLRAADSRVLGERGLPGNGSCEELARAAAVVLASWLTDAHPELVPTLPMPPLAERAPVASAEPSVRPAPPAPSGVVSSRGELVPRGGFRARTALTLGLGFAPTPLAFVAGAGVALVPAGSGVGAALHAGFSTWRSVDVDGGRAVYRRWPLGAGAVLRFAGASVSGEVESGAAMGWLALEGRAFGVSHDASDATFGPFLTARAIGPGSLIAPLVELSGVYWARATRVYGDPSRPSRALPSLELSLSVGLAVTP